MKRAKHGDDIYAQSLPVALPSRDGSLPFDCDMCHRLFLVQEIKAFAEPFLNRGQQWGKIICPRCGYKMEITFAVDSKQ